MTSVSRVGSAGRRAYVQGIGSGPEVRDLRRALPEKGNKIEDSSDSE